MSAQAPYVDQPHEETGYGCWCHPAILCAWCDQRGGHCGHPGPFIVLHNYAKGD